MNGFAKFFQLTGGLVATFFIYAAYQAGYDQFGRISEPWSGSENIFLRVLNYWPGLLIGLVLAGIGGAIESRQLKKEQVDRRTKAGRVFFAIQEKRKPEPYSLFLRPFDIDEEYTVPSRHQEVSNWIPGSPPVYVPVDRALVESNRFLDLIGVRLSSSSFRFGGFGEIVLQDSDNWKLQVKLLIRDASQLVVVPGRSESMKWEIAMIRELGKLGVTIFIRTPQGFKGITNFEEDFGIPFNARIDDAPHVFRLSETGEVYELSSLTNL